MDVKNSTGMRFLDWPTADNKDAVHEGLQAMMILTMESGERLMKLLDEPAIAETCTEADRQTPQARPHPQRTQIPRRTHRARRPPRPRETAAALKKDGPKDLSTFYGFYVIEHSAKPVKPRRRST
jgi:alpha-L-rhamnosidase